MECERRARNLKVATALDLPGPDEVESRDPRKGLEKELFIGFRGPHAHILRKTEAQIRAFLQPDPSAFTSSVLNLSPMRAPVRQLIHLMAPWYGLFSESVDPEPRRSVRLLRTQASPGENELPDLLSNMDLAIDVGTDEEEDAEGERDEDTRVGPASSSNGTTMIPKQEVEEGWKRVGKPLSTTTLSNLKETEGASKQKPIPTSGFASLPSSVSEVVDDWTELLQSSEDEDEEDD
ncbi:hypothetical protein BJ684DRAFT_21522 [Piptocephalis cylindrospora]|uniref:R3H domain-containing protein n=1 Tax=Piptocephalis cylindrospora TaxID=1907219 RepID=A0A4P9Y1G0_9FUNG|nr:hypothetical protein BJ684DRAFT_21522 [Piptocephalis cylindrospora]|eukprot:RKP11901.1 hypothetical protein BJ684DRAFT_21522 [Piptocephalis cylindrospora]